MSRLSIIIPAVEDDARLELTLVSVLQHRPTDTEVLVVFPGKYSDPYNLQGEVRFVEVARQASLVDCLRAGCKAAQAPIVHLLAPGIEVVEGWAEAPLKQFAAPHVAAVAPLIFESEQLATSGVDYLAAGRRLVRTYDLADVQVRLPLGPELRGAFYRVAALSEVGGLPRSVGPEWADLDLAIALLQAGYRTVVEPASHLVAADPLPTRPGAFKRGLYAERVFWRTAPVVGWGRALLGHPVEAARDSITSGGLSGIALNLLGRALACFQVLGHRARHKQLRSLAHATCRAESGARSALERSEHLRLDGSHPNTTAAFRSPEVARQ